MRRGSTSSHESFLMTTLISPQRLPLVPPQVQHSWARLRRGLAHLTSADPVRSRRGAATFDLVVDGLVDEAWPYVDALVDAVEAGRPSVRAWWRTHGTGLLELRCEIWGSGSHLHVTRTAAGARCVLQRAPETTWSGGGPAARAQLDVQQSVVAVAAALQLAPPPGLRHS